MSDLIARLGDQIEAIADAPTPRNMADAHETLAELAAALRQKEEQRAAAMNLYESTLTAQMAAEARVAAAERELAELRAQQPPREPTERMMQAAYEDWNNTTGAGKPRSKSAAIRECWRAMYDAAPPAQQPKAE